MTFFVTDFAREAVCTYLERLRSLLILTTVAQFIEKSDSVDQIFTFLKPLSRYHVLNVAKFQNCVLNNVTFMLFMVNNSKSQRIHRLTTDDNENHMRVADVYKITFLKILNVLSISNACKQSV